MAIPSVMQMKPVIPTSPPPVDTDNDQLPDYRDLDSDDGGVSDEVESQLHETDPTDPSDDGIGWLRWTAQRWRCGLHDESINAPAWLLLLCALIGIRWRKQ